MTAVGSTGSILATNTGAFSLTATITLPSDWTIAPSLMISSVKAPVPFASGFSGTSAKLPSVLAVAVPTTLPFHFSVTFAPGSARPATMASPVFSMRTVSKANVSAGFGGTITGAATFGTTLGLTTGVTIVTASGCFTGSAKTTTSGAATSGFLPSVTLTAGTSKGFSIGATFAATMGLRLCWAT